MQTLETMTALIKSCTYKKGWTFLCKQDDRGVFLQVSVDEQAEAARDAFSEGVAPWKGAKHYLSPHMCDSEVVGSVFGAIKQAEEHEMREWFRFNKKCIYNPHMSVYALAEIAGKLHNLDMRENAMTMEEN